MTKKPPQLPSGTPISRLATGPGAGPDTTPVVEPDTAKLIGEMQQRIEVLEAQIAGLKLYLADFLAAHAETATPPKGPEDDGAGDADR